MNIKDFAEAIKPILTASPLPPGQLRVECNAIEAMFKRRMRVLYELGYIRKTGLNVEWMGKDTGKLTGDPHPPGFDYQGKYVGIKATETVKVAVEPKEPAPEPVEVIIPADAPPEPAITPVKAPKAILQPRFEPEPDGPRIWKFGQSVECRSVYRQGTIAVVNAEGMSPWVGCSECGHDVKGGAFSHCHN
jgi:hypothetical protein